MFDMLQARDRLVIAVLQVLYSPAVGGPVQLSKLTEAAAESADFSSSTDTTQQAGLAAAGACNSSTGECCGGTCGSTADQQAASGSSSSKTSVGAEAERAVVKGAAPCSCSSDGGQCCQPSGSSPQQDQDEQQQQQEQMRGGQPHWHQGQQRSHTLDKQKRATLKSLDGGSSGKAAATCSSASKPRLGLVALWLISLVLLVMAGASVAGLWTIVLLLAQLPSSWISRATSSAGPLPECRLQWT